MSGNGGRDAPWSLLAGLLEQAAISRHTLSRQDKARTCAPTAASGSANTFIPNPPPSSLSFFPPTYMPPLKSSQKTTPHPLFFPPNMDPHSWCADISPASGIPHGCLLLVPFCAPWRESGMCVWSFWPSLLKGSGRRARFRGAASPPSCCWWGHRHRRWRVATCAHFWKLVSG